MVLRMCSPNFELVLHSAHRSPCKQHLPWYLDFCLSVGHSSRLLVKFLMANRVLSCGYPIAPRV